jgi:hypothetical protein
MTDAGEIERCLEKVKMGLPAWLWGEGREIMKNVVLLTAWRCRFWGSASNR